MKLSKIVVRGLPKARATRLGSPLCMKVAMVPKKEERERERRILDEREGELVGLLMSMGRVGDDGGAPL